VSGGEFLDDTHDLKDVRPDGIHLSADAALWIAEGVHRDVVERYGRDRPADLLRADESARVRHK
jgi:hypothetical protein